MYRHHPNPATVHTDLAIPLATFHPFTRPTNTNPRRVDSHHSAIATAAATSSSDLNRDLEAARRAHRRDRGRAAVKLLCAGLSTLILLGVVVMVIGAMVHKGGKHGNAAPA
ncbi:hypothetical protein LTR53_017554, partial [Teratosphaeriaceae sp. CCFEE 6253]